MKFLTLMLFALLFVSCSHHGHMKNMDGNGDGKVTKEEWSKGHDEMFSKMDKNANGEIEADEMKDCKKSCHEKKSGDCASKKSCGKCAESKDKCSKCSGTCDSADKSSKECGKEKCEGK
jgi:hypothetical protein